MIRKTFTAIMLVFIMVAVSACGQVNSKPEPAEETSLIDGMSLREKVEQMMMVDFRKWNEEPVTEMNDEIADVLREHDFGAVILFSDNMETTENTIGLTKAMQECSDIPLIIATDQEGGSVYRLGSGTALPGNMALGAAGDIEAAHEAGEIIGSELKAVGINAALAPVADVNSNANNPVIGLRSFGDDPEKVGELAAGVAEGITDNGVIACAKHFPGHGNTFVDSHYGLPVVEKSRESLDQCDLLPFKKLADGDVDMVLTAHVIFPALEKDRVMSDKTGKEEHLPATMSDDIITGILKGDMGFEGIVVTDAMNMAGVAERWGKSESLILAIKAGADMICMPRELECMEDVEKLDNMIDRIVKAVEAGEISKERIDDACERIMRVKEKRGILDYDDASMTLENARKVVGSDENREKEREIAARAVTVIENRNETLPLEINTESKVLMLTPYSNEEAQMIMGWNRAKLPEGAELRVKSYDKGYDSIKEDVLWADTIIMNSEISGTGAIKSRSFTYEVPQKVMNHSKKKRLIVISVDKPYDVQLYGDADAVLAVYGCSGSSMDPTEAITGKTSSSSACGPNMAAGMEVVLGLEKAQGTLPVDIPVLDIEKAKFTDETAYERGYGITEY